MAAGSSIVDGEDEFSDAFLTSDVDEEDSSPPHDGEPDGAPGGLTSLFASLQAAHEAVTAPFAVGGTWDPIHSVDWDMVKPTEQCFLRIKRCVGCEINWRGSLGQKYVGVYFN